MLLSEITSKIVYSCNNFRDIQISSLCYDSRKASNGSLFVCLVGANADGHNYIDSAYKNGCRAFAVQKDIDGYDDAVFLKFENTRKALALMSSAFFGYPAKKLTVIGITGTKGKTSISFMLRSIFEKMGKKVGIIGTTGIIYGDIFIKSDNSTPESYEIQKYFADMLNKGIDTVVMEVSSQGLMMHRTFGILFDAAIYTNLSPDHIGKDEHSSFEEYRYCKSLLFAQTKNVFANADDENCDFVISKFNGVPVHYSIDKNSDFKAEDIVFNTDSTTDFNLLYNGKKCHIKLNIPGKFSVYNSLAAISTAAFFGATEKNIYEGILSATVEGRMQKISCGLPYTVIIDYAHNELSMDNLYSTVENMPHKHIITVFGCGGNRAKSRRYDMGRIAAARSDMCVITSDNPRFEKLENIIEDIRVGIKLGLEKNPACKVEEIKDRKEAIIFALKSAEKGDIILIPGKGHQHYEEIEGIKIPFNEKEIVEEYAQNTLTVRI